MEWSFKKCWPNPEQGGWAVFHLQHLQELWVFHCSSYKDLKSAQKGAPECACACPLLLPAKNNPLIIKKIHPFQTMNGRQNVFFTQEASNWLWT